MSEYQYYEFMAVDRSLDEQQLREVRALSTRARITPRSFVKTYARGLGAEACRSEAEQT